MKAVIYVTLKTEVNDPAGRVVAERLADMGFTEVKQARIGKLIELEIEAADRENAAERVKQMCERLLANALVEEYKVISVQ